jgi:putative hemolysin
VQGLVTLIDVMEAIVGDLPELGDRQEPEVVKRDDGTWLVDGSLTIEELHRRFELPALPGEEDEDFETLGGFILDRFGHIPRAGEQLTCLGWRFEVVDMDRNRVDKVILGKLPATP